MKRGSVMESFFTDLDSGFARSFIWIFMPKFLDKFPFWKFHKNNSLPDFPSNFY